MHTDLTIQDELIRQNLAYLEVDGYLDASNFERMEEAFERYLDNGVFRIIVNAHKLEYISSAGAGVFIGALGTAQENQGNIVLVSPTEEVRDVFELLGVLQIFPVVSTREEALEHLHDAKESFSRRL